MARNAFFARSKRNSKGSEGYDRNYRGKQVIVAYESDSSCSDVSSVLGISMSNTTNNRFLDEKGHQGLFKSDVMFEECLDPPKKEQLLVSKEEGDEPTIVIEVEGDGVVDPNGSPFASHILTTDVELEMTPLVSVVDKDDNFVCEVDMADNLYRFSNHCKKGCYLNLTMASYNKLNINKEITVCQPRSSSFMTVRLIRDIRKFHNVTRSEQARGTMEFTTSVVGYSIKQSRSTQEEELPSVVERSLASCLTQESYALEHSLINPEGNQPIGEQEIPSNEAAYMEKEVNSSWSNTDIVHLQESYVLKKKPVQFGKK